MDTLSQNKPQEIESLITALDSRDRTTREQARTKLVKLGSPALTVPVAASKALKELET